mmetsp:Transcript_6164/g.5510  ORF Transcript_6164/g.5510 Transcript_6164/m.5510 type:complete len:201 (-) Transcript_6164:16-618(-)
MLSIISQRKITLNFSLLKKFLSDSKNQTNQTTAEKIGNINFDQFKSEDEVVLVTKRDIPQSPFKMRFLVMLIRDAWVPDALAQLKFSPKPRCEDVAKIVKRGVVLAKLQFDAIPEELRVKEVLVSKGMAIKKMRIMGRGRTGFGYKRYTHVRIQIEKINFDKMISQQKSYNQKLKWTKRKQLVEKIKADISTKLIAENTA